MSSSKLSSLADLEGLFTSSGLSTAPPQVWRTLRLVPILSSEIRSDLRLARRIYDDCQAVVELPQNMAYISYVPHAYVLEWDAEGIPQALTDTQLGKDGKRWKGLPVRSLPRMAKHERGPQQQRRLRFLPLHLAMEGYLSAYFNAPQVDWRDDYLRYTVSHGLSPRWENVLSGEYLFGLEEALRVFEIHERQVGLMLFVADALASVIVYPHPADYRLLHRSLLSDFFCETIAYYYAHLPYLAPQFPLPPAGEIQSWSGYRERLQTLRSELDDFQRWMGAGVLSQPLNLLRVQSLGPYTLERFLTRLVTQDQDAHMGEVILGSDGRLAYLKTCALTRDQVRRAWYLQLLAEHAWHLETAAVSLNISKDQLIIKLDTCGLGRLLQPKLIVQAHKRMKGL